MRRPLVVAQAYVGWLTCRRRRVVWGNHHRARGPTTLTNARLCLAVCVCCVCVPMRMPVPRAALKLGLMGEARTSAGEEQRAVACVWRKPRYLRGVALYRRVSYGPRTKNKRNGGSQSHIAPITLGMWGARNKSARPGRAGVKTLHFLSCEGRRGEQKVGPSEAVLKGCRERHGTLGAS